MKLNNLVMVDSGKSTALIDVKEEGRFLLWKLLKKKCIIACFSGESKKKTLDQHGPIWQ